MPLYEYECPKCKRQQEEHHKISETPVVLCGACIEPMKKVILSAPLMRMGVGHAWNGAQAEIDKMKKKKRIKK